MPTQLRWALVVAVYLVMPGLLTAETVIDFAAYRSDCEVRVGAFNGHLVVTWPTGAGEDAEVALDLSGERPLIERLAVRRDNADAVTILGGVDPVWFLTVGERRARDEKTPDEKWQVFFDNPQKRPHETFASKLAIKSARVIGSGKRATILIDGLSVGPFAGAIEFSFYAGSRLMRIDALIATEKDRLAVFYDAGLMSEQPNWKNVAWMDTQGQAQRTTPHNPARIQNDVKKTSVAPGGQSPLPPQAIEVRHRAIIAEGKRGSVACFPPPHQFQFPRDFSTNLGFVWAGEGYQGQARKVGFGVRQHKDGGGNFVPWFNAPPGVAHRMGAFYLLTSGNADAAMEETLKLTNGDRFVELPGYKTFTSHYHMATAVRAMKEQAAGIERRDAPEYVGMFKDMGVNMVHQGEFHGDGHPRDPGPLRLPEMQAMFEECRRWSGEDFLLIPGEEGSDYLGMNIQGKHPGHWMSLFPRPIYWTMVRGEEQPFAEEIEPYGKVYHVGSRGDMIRLLKEERGLAWSAHPRLKASSWTPDVFREEDFFLGEYWLGAAWKAMPGDLSREKQGERVLDLMDDMANWGQRKYVPGEVDVFTIDRTHELYGHMNVNYMKLDRVPQFDEGWQPVLDVLSSGQFFVTTGEVLIPSFTVGGKGSGEILKVAAHDQPEMKAEIGWTFPLAFAEVVSGDGQKVYRERIDLSNTEAFGSRFLNIQPQMKGRRWVRLEVWDIAANGAFTQPVWIE